jgi:hypothetical protein
MPTWDMAAIRQLFYAAFSDGELTNFCFDYFRPVYNEFSGGMSRGAKIQRLLEYCENHDLVETLLKRAEKANPRQYRKFAHLLQPDLAVDTTPPQPQTDVVQPPDSQPSTSNEYFDLLIRIHGFDPEIQANPVEALLGNDSHFEGGELHLDQDRLSAEETNPQEYGTILFDALFSGQIRDAYNQAVAYADIQTEKRIRVRLWIDNDAAELHGLVWERLHHRAQGAMFPLAASSEMPFSRYTGLTTSEPDPIAERPVRLLFAISNPADLPTHLAPLDVEKEVTNLLDALGDLRGGERLQVTLMPGWTGLSDDLHSTLVDEGYQICQGTTSIDNIIRTLSRDGGYHILHYLGHGQFGRQQPGKAHLFLEDENGNVELMRDERIATLLKSVGSQLRLVFLAACESAKRTSGSNSPFVGLAPKLIQARIPAVVAMQDTVQVTTAQKLTYDFYSYLLEHGVVDRAMNQARLLLFRTGGSDWATPVLFMRLKDGRLFG